ncbi:MAG: chorismate mutase [Actinomycetota bacterium]|jgi:chorismate mutase|nr:chorismate mutase [Actinomycetota bacterium]
MKVRALRGATTVPANSAEAIVKATGELLGEMLARNSVEPADVISIVFTSTADLDAEFPAAAARGIGLDQVPLLCATEIPVPGSLEACVRVLLHLYTPRDYASLRHVYLNGATALRSDLAGEP